MIWYTDDTDTDIVLQYTTIIFLIVLNRTLHSKLPRLLIQYTTAVCEWLIVMITIFNGQKKKFKKIQFITLHKNDSSKISKVLIYF